MLRFLRRHQKLFLRLSLAGTGVLIALPALAALFRGEPDYRNFFHQPVAAGVAGLLGLALLLAACLPWVWQREAPTDGSPGRKSPPGWTPPPRRVPELPGRNELCPCGSGEKYKKCCLERDHAMAREDDLKRRSTALNQAQGTGSGTAMANRGLRGR